MDANPPSTKPTNVGQLTRTRVRRRRIQKPQYTRRSTELGQRRVARIHKFSNYMTLVTLVAGIFSIISLTPPVYDYTQAAVGFCADMVGSFTNSSEEAEADPSQPSAPYQISHCRSRESAYAGDVVEFSITLQVTGSTPLTDVVIYPKTLNERNGRLVYLPGAETLQINGEPHGLKDDWYIEGYRIPRLEPGSWLQIKYIAEINYSALPGEEIISWINLSSQEYGAVERCAGEVVVLRY